MTNQANILHYKAQSHSKRLSDAVSEMFLDKTFCDIEIKIESKVFQCHRIILAAMCPYFKIMFSTALKEKDQSQIELKGIDPCTFQDILNYIYLGKVDITIVNVEALLQAADMYDIAELKHGCSLFYLENLDENNCLCVWKLAEQFNSPDLVRTAMDVAIDKFTEVIKGNDFLQMEYPDLLKYFSSENLNVDNEAQVLEAAVNWIEYNLASNTKYLTELISVINLKDISPNILQKYLDKKFISLDENICLLIKAVIDHQLYNKALPNYTKHHTRIHSQYQEHMVILGGSKQTPHGCYSVPDIHMVNMSKLSTEFNIKKLGTLPTYTGTTFLAACAVHNLIYVSGIGEHSNEVWNYNICSNEWKLSPELNTGRGGHEMIVGPKFQLYVLGGYHSLRVLSSVEVMNPNHSHQWKEVCNLAVAVGNFSALYYNSSIYVFGGKQDFQNGIDIIQNFDLHTNSATVLSVKLPVVCGSSQITTWMNSAILVSDVATLIINMQTLSDESSPSHSTVHRNNNKTPLFQIKEKVDLQGFHMVNFRGKLFITGGESTNEDGPKKYKRDILVAEIKDIFSSNDNIFTTLHYLPEPLAYHTSVTVKSLKGEIENH